MRMPTIADLEESRVAIKKTAADAKMMNEEIARGHRTQDAIDNRRQWVVIEHGTPDSDRWELSVCARGTHGCVSYGWGGVEKHIVWSEGGPCRHTPHPMLVEGYRELAKKLADNLNG